MSHLYQLIRSFALALQGLEPLDKVHESTTHVHYFFPRQRGRRGTTNPRER